MFGVLGGVSLGVGLIGQGLAARRMSRLARGVSIDTSTLEDELAYRPNNIRLAGRDATAAGYTFNQGNFQEAAATRGVTGRNQYGSLLSTARESAMAKRGSFINQRLTQRDADERRRRDDANRQIMAARAQEQQLKAGLRSQGAQMWGQMGSQVSELGASMLGMSAQNSMSKTSMGNKLSAAGAGGGGGAFAGKGAGPVTTKTSSGLSPVGSIHIAPQPQMMQSLGPEQLGQEGFGSYSLRQTNPYPHWRNHSYNQATYRTRDR